MIRKWHNDLMRQKLLPLLSPAQPSLLSLTQFLAMATYSKHALPLATLQSAC
jgi:hypothetical protein